MPHASSPLHTLAERVGILSEYVSQDRADVRVTSDETRVALLAALGIDASSAAAAGAALQALDAEEAEELVAPAQVVAEGKPGARLLTVRLPEAWRQMPLDFSLEVREENGEVHHASGALRPQRARHARRGGDAEDVRHGPPVHHVRLRLPSTLPLGYHTARVRVCGAREEREGEQRLIITPRSCPAPADRLGHRRAFGVIANLYTVRSARNWGAGDLTDLRNLATWSAEVGAEFVGVNPLHALRNRGTAISPYSPVSRLFRNVLYLDVEATPELAECAEAREMLASTAVQRELQLLRASERVEYERVMALKRPMLELLHRTFVRLHGAGGDAHGGAYARYVEREGEALVDFATFLALDAHFGARGAGAATGEATRGSDWHDWPAPYRDPRSREVAAFRESHRDEVDFHCWLQFELDRQLGAAAEAGGRAGLAIGLYRDLAIGTASDGSDSWAFPGLFVRGASIGAPPDALAPQGQNWALPPVDPRRLRRDGYRYWTLLLRTALGHAGAVRIDHVMGLFRQFWIPAGLSGSAGAYVRFPASDLLGILALESGRHGALVVGEDLGTVPPEVPRALRRWNILSSRVLYFERTRRGGFRRAASFEPMSLATANTHDLVPLAGFWAGRDIALRRSLGLIASDEAADAAYAERARTRLALLRRLVADRALPAGGTGGRDVALLPGAVHAFLCATPAVLVGLSLDDLVGETDPVNLPGVDPEVYPSWTRRLRVPLEALPDDPGVAAALHCGRAEDRERPAP